VVRHQLVMFVHDPCLSSTGANFSGRLDQVFLGTVLGAVIGTRFVLT
jgi:hypothetical protein